MKMTTYETLYHEDHGATLKHKCGKRIVALSLLSFSLIFCFFGTLFLPLFFVRSLIPTCLGIIASIILPSLGQCSNNEDHHTFIYLQPKDYNLILRTKYDSICMPPRCTGMCNESRVTCMIELWTVALPQIWCQLHDHAKQNENDEACHNKRNGGKLHGNISRNGYGNAIIGRYGGCFEEGIWWVYGTGESCAVLERLAMVEGWECV